MLSILISTIGILITILFVIGTHEWAHFMAARLLGVKVLRFSIGFGKTLWHRVDKKGTEYVLALVPLGGYVKMLDESEGIVPKDQLAYTYNRAPYWKKCLIVLAGPMMNLFCAFILYWMVFGIGFTSVKPVIGTVDPRSIAAEAGLKPKQEIISVDNEPTQTWTSIVFRLIAHAGDKDDLKLETRPLDQPGIQSYELDLSHWHFDPLTPDLLGSIGINPYVPDIPLVIGMIGKDTPATHSSLLLGDKIISVDKEKIKDWEQLVELLEQHPDATLSFTIERNKQLLQIPVAVGSKHTWLWKKYGYLGVGPKFDWPKDLLQNVKYTPFGAAAHAWQQIYDFSYFNLLLFGKMITGKLSVKSLGGPITIFESAGSALNGGTLIFISFLAFLSVSIGLINLFPIPGLDGGHILIHTIELIIQRPLPEHFVMIIYRLGLLFILFILLQALINDIMRLY